MCFERRAALNTGRLFPQQGYGSAACFGAGQDPVGKLPLGSAAFDTCTSSSHLTRSIDKPRSAWAWRSGQWMLTRGFCTFSLPDCTLFFVSQDSSAPSLTDLRVRFLWQLLCNWCQEQNVPKPNQLFPPAIVLLLTGSDSGGRPCSPSDAVFCQDGCITCFSPVAP